MQAMKMTNQQIVDLFNMHDDSNVMVMPYDEDGSTWFWMCKLIDELVISEPFGSWNDCYMQYLDAMYNLQRGGADLSEAAFRGVFDGARATEIMTMHMQGEV